MVLPSVDNSSGSWAKHKPGQAADTAKPLTANKLSEQDAADKQETHLRIQEKKQPAERESGLKPLADETFSASSNTSDEEDVTAAQQTGNTPDFTLELTSPSFKEPQLAASRPQKNTQDSKDASERPALPYTFSFGVRRPFAIAVAMSKPLLGNEAPSSFSQAIQQTLDLAATNRLPYEKGGQISLVA
ncbi:hypothetical protein [Marinospirillum sp.]|uniref:hypothetical protein n=1 Tax=Marinospirillum sp. TaxID=2183934 RepID=UPI0028706454|nr:hypothetical protein [Marinospirillum sp.]MDR9467477.1 hypothetical protein [Marinospirillum sp.]